MRWLPALLFAAFAAVATAQPVQTQNEALADDAIQYAAQFGILPSEALQRLKAQQASVAATDAIARELVSPASGFRRRSKLRNR